MDLFYLNLFMIDLMYNKIFGHSSSLNYAFTAFRGRSAHCGATLDYVGLFASIELIEDIGAYIYIKKRQRHSKQRPSTKPRSN